MDTSYNSGSVTTVTRRRAVASLSPAKQRYSLGSNGHHHVPNGIHHSDKPPMRARNSIHSIAGSIIVHNSTGKTKSSNLATGSRPPTKPPPLPRSSIAVSQEESCMVSAAGDVLVCRNRDFALLVGDGLHGNGRYDGDNGNHNRNHSAMNWCDLECSEFPMNLEKSALCNSWLKRTPDQKEEKKEDDTPLRSPTAPIGSGLRGGGSSYEWGARRSDAVDQAQTAFGQLELEVVNSTSPVSPRDNASLTGNDDVEDNVLSMPSFDYSHFGNGGNDMLPMPPIRGTHNPKRPTDSAEIDVHLPPKHPQNASRTSSYGNNNNTHRNQYSSASAQLSVNSNNNAAGISNSTFLHGVPTFLKSLSQIRIQQVSAHPRGSHVLLISAEQLLFSYGLNDHGQLGIGIKSPPPGREHDSSHHLKYVWTPTIITPLLENGGKAITCAAGESHSLVVVSTEGRRILKSRYAKNQEATGGGSKNNIGEEGGPPFEMNRVISSPPTMDMEKDYNGYESERSIASTSTVESVYHHQLYGFGRNNFMKIGLVRPRLKTTPGQSPQAPSTTTADEASAVSDSVHDDMEDILLPHRVALHCTVWPEKSTSEENDEALNGAIGSAMPPRGIFALAASSEHSAALVRRATGDIEMYTWGNAAFHALGVTTNGKPKSQAPKLVPVPTLVERLSYSAKSESLSSPNRLFKMNPPEFPVDVSLGPYSSYVVTSLGRCLSFGISYDGMLGLGRDITEAQEPKTIKFPCGNNPNSLISITSISAGTGHVMALAKCGTVFTWGKNTDGRLGLGDNATSSKGVVASDSDNKIEWTPQRLQPLSKTVTQTSIPTITSNSGSIGGAVPLAPPKDEFGPIVQVCAGLDCSMFVTASGRVLSCGKNSGRLGLGELQGDATTPTPLFGGLSLWHRPVVAKPASRRSSPSPNKNRPVLKRGMTTPG